MAAKTSAPMWTPALRRNRRHPSQQINGVDVFLAGTGPPRGGACSFPSDPPPPFHHLLFAGVPRSLDWIIRPRPPPPTRRPNPPTIFPSNNFISFKTAPIHFFFSFYFFTKIIATSSPTGGTWLCNKNFPPFQGKCPYRRRCQLGRRRRQSHVVKTGKIDKHLATLPPAGVLVDTDAAADKPPTNKIRIIDAFNMQISNPKITKKHETINASLSRPVTQNGRLHIQISRPLFITSLIIHGR